MMEKKEAIREYSLNLALALLQGTWKLTDRVPDASVLIKVARDIEKYIIS